MKEKQVNNNHDQEMVCHHRPIQRKTFKQQMVHANHGTVGQI
jgi:hypothetical protein